MTTETEVNRTDMTERPRFGPTFLPLYGLGLIGVLSLIPTIITQLNALPPEQVTLPVPLLILVSLINPALLLTAAVAAGALLAHRVGLRSLVAEKVRDGSPIWPRLRPHILRAFVMGAVFLVVVIGADAVLNPFADTELLTGPAAEAGADAATLG